MRIGIVGYGVVGKHLHKDIKDKHDVYVYDPAYSMQGKDDINRCDAAFVCVPTPMAEDGSADLSAIRDVFSWLDTPVQIIRSTVPPGTTKKLERAWQSQGHGDWSRIVFVPELIGEGVNAPYNEMKQPPFLIIGGMEMARDNAVDIFSRIYNSECEFVLMDSTTAEICKYAENYFLALKVSWANELYDICGKVNADFNQMMQAVTHDYRIGRSHTHVYPDNRGWGGRCLPKDLSALRSVVGETAPLLDALIKVNEKVRGGERRD